MSLCLVVFLLQVTKDVTDNKENKTDTLKRSYVLELDNNE